MGATGRTFGGPCVLTRDMIYLIVTGDAARNQLNSSMGGVAGLMERAQGLIQLVPIPGLDQYELSLEELQARIGDDSNWPVEWIGERVFAFPKSSIPSLRCSLMFGLAFKVDGHIRVCVSCNGTDRRAAAEFLERYGWPLDSRSFMDRIRGRAA
ncbi:MAG: hypothetical protein ACF8PN_10890 [Phycisphaerales bacterium]